MKTLKSTVSSITLRALSAAIVADIGAFHFGYGISYSSPVATELLQKGILTKDEFPVFASIISLGAAIGALVCIPFVQPLGRKAIIQLNSIIGALGWLLIATGTNATHLIVGRILSGASIGVYAVVIPMYIGEIAHYETKALITNSFSILLRMGIIVANLLGIFLPFRALALFPVALILFQTVVMSFQPYSPIWLISRGLDNQGYRVLESLRSKDCDCPSEYNAIKSVLNETQISFGRKIKLLAKPYHLKALIIGLTLVAAVQSTGVPIFITYASDVYRSNKILEPDYAAVLQGVVMVVGTLLASLLYDRIGRKSLTILSAVGTVICLIGLGIGSLLVERSPPCQDTAMEYNTTLIGEDGCIAVSICAIVNLNIIFFLFGIGWGSLMWVLLAEMLPVRVKTVASGLAQVNLWLVTFLITLAWPYLEDWFGTSYAFFIFAVINFVSLVFVILFIPETKRKPINEIEKLFKERTIFCDICSIRYCCCCCFRKSRGYEVL